MTIDTQHIQTRKRNGIFIHVAAWCILLILPLVFFERLKGGGPVPDYWLGRLFIQPVCIIILFYINYWFLIDRTLFRKKNIHFITYNLLLVIALCFIIFYVHQAFGPSGGFHDRHPGGHRPPPSIFMPWQDVIILILVVGLSVAVRMTQRWIVSEKTRQQLEQEHTEAELKNLKNQLNPHFLFNTLNNIYSLIAISPERAQSAILELSKLLRYGVYENTHTHVPIEKELEFNRNYIELMRLRLARHVQVEVNIPDGVCRERQIAPLLFISLIENAFKHGTSATAKSFVKIQITEPSPGVVDCHIENSYFPKDETDKSGSGVGLKNLSRQLELLYPGKYTLLAEYDSTTYRSTLTIDLN